MKNNLIAVGARLKQIREQKGWTQEQFGKMLLGKENKGTISAYESGKLPIAEKAKVQLFTTMGVNKTWLETGEGEMFTTMSENIQELSKDLGKPIDKSLLAHIKSAIWDFLKSGHVTKKDIEEAEQILKKLEEK